MLANLVSTATRLGLPFGSRSMTFNSRRAQELGKWAESQGQGEAFHLAAFHAYFAEGRNIALPEVLLDIAGQRGLDRGLAETALVERPFKGAVDDDWFRSRHLGITAVPTFKFNERVMVGAQPYPALQKLVQS